MSLINRDNKMFKKEKYNAGDASRAYEDMALISEIKQAKWKEEMGMQITAGEEKLLEHERALRRRKKKTSKKYKEEDEYE